MGWPQSNRLHQHLQAALRLGTMNSLHYISTTLQRRKLAPKPTINDTELTTVNGSGDKVSDNDDTETSDVTSDGKCENKEEEENNEKVFSDFPVEAKTAAGLISSIIYTILFVPKLLIYIPLYYLIFTLFYPFRKIYRLILYLFSLDERNHSEYTDLAMDTPDVRPTSESTNDSISHLLDSDSATPSLPTTSSSIANSDITDETGSTTPLKSSSTPSPPLSSPLKGNCRYAPKSSISTILEESMEFDPDYHENDDYFKSPSDSNPITPSINLIPETDTPSKPSKVSRLNYKLLQAVNSTPSFSTGSSEEESSNKPGSGNLTVPLLESSPAVLKSSSESISSSAPPNTSQTKRKKKKKFIFPKLLFDFNIFDPPKLPRKTLVLDLDETLIHSLSRYNSSTLNKAKGRSIEVKVMGSLPTLYHIYKRPYVEEFLSVVYQWFDLVCFTASIKEYADPVIDFLEEQVLSHDVMKKSLKKSQAEPPTKLFKSRYYRNSCIFVEGKGYLKDLSVVLNDENRQPHSRSNSKTRSRASSISSNVSRSNSSKAMDYSKIIIIDNSPISYVRHKDNGLMIEGWINDPEDTELMNLLPLLNSLRFVSDVRCILGLKEGQRAFA